MPIIKEVEFHDNSYNSSTKIFPYLNVSEASHLRFSVQCSQAYDLILDWSWDSNFVSFQTDTYSALGGVILYQPTDIKSRYVQVSISLNSIPSVVHLSGFYNTTDTNDSNVVDIANQPISTTFTNTSIDISNQPISTTFTNSSVAVNNFTKSAFGEHLYVSPRPLVQYLFDVGTSGDLQAGTWKVPYTDLKSYGSDVLSVSISNGILKLTGANWFANRRGAIYGSPWTYRPGQGISCTFTGYVFQDTRNILGDYSWDSYLGMGNWDTGTNSIQDGYFVGRVQDASLPGAQDNATFCIIYYNNSVRTFVPRSQWNGDRGDGTGSLPLMDFSKMQVYKILYQYLGFGIVRFYIEHPSTGEFVLLHSINRVNQFESPSNLKDPSLSFLIYRDTTIGLANPTGSADAIGCSSFNMSLEGDIVQSNDRICIEGSKSILAGIETVILNIRNDPTFYGTQNRRRLHFDYFSIAVDSTKSVVVRIYRNCTLSGPSWTTPNSNLFPISYDSVGTVSAYGLYLVGFSLAKVDNIHELLDQLHMYLSNSDIYTITAKSTANSDVYVNGSFHIA